MRKLLHDCLSIFLCLLVCVQCITLDDYCKLDMKNTPCATKCARSKVCGDTDDEFELFSDEQRLQVVHKHNTLRDRVAKGDFAESNLPAGVGGIKAMSYDKECEFMAACHIRSCVMIRDKAAQSLGGQEFGQNLNENITPDMVGFQTNFVDLVIQAWFDQYKSFTEDITASFKPVENTEYVTQIIWGDTDKVGCAKMHYLRNKMHVYAMYCNYLPKGNVEGDKVYAAGECSKPNSEFPNLCGSVRALAEDSFGPPKEIFSNKTVRLRGNVVYLFGVISVLAYLMR